MVKIGIRIGNFIIFTDSFIVLLKKIKPFTKYAKIRCIM